MMCRKLVLTLLLFSAFALSAYAEEGAGPEERTSPYAQALAGFSTATRANSAPEDIGKAFDRCLSVIERIADAELRQQRAGELFRVIHSSNNEITVAAIYERLPRLVNTEVYGKHIAFAALSLMREHGELRFVRLTSRAGLNEGTAGEFVCFYNAPLNSAINSICGEHENSGGISQKSAQQFRRAAENAFKSEEPLILPKEHQQDLVRIYYETDNIELRKGVVESLLLSGNYALGFRLADLLSEKDHVAASVYKKMIPPESRGKSNPDYIGDADEIK